MAQKTKADLQDRVDQLERMIDAVREEMYGARNERDGARRDLETMTECRDRLNFDIRKAKEIQALAEASLERAIGAIIAVKGSQFVNEELFPATITCEEPVWSRTS